MDLSHLRIISAGAGSGKTFRLTEELSGLLINGYVRPHGIIATTFTRKAAAELQERVRIKLLTEGRTAEAEALNNALIGTVHGLGVKLLQRFAYEAGVSPDVSIIADEDQQLLFNQSLSTILTEERVERMDTLCYRLGLDGNDYFDWRSELRKLTEVARANAFSEEVLLDSAQRSIDQFQEFLAPVSDRSAEAWTQQLLGELDGAITSIQHGEDGTKATQGVLSLLRRLHRELHVRGELTWPDWARLSKLKPGAKSREAVESLVEYATGHDAHPRLHEDVAAFIQTLFGLAIAAMEEYEAYKKRRGLIDYTDMEVLVNNILDKEIVQEVLREELDLLMVDEFQDTSPIQLAIFLKMARLAKQSIWVGDPKQSIYGFRGADPSLMQAIIQASGGVAPDDIQDTSWRSREDIVYACNALFTKAFPGMNVEHVALKPNRRQKAGEHTQNKEDEPTDMAHALHHWHFAYEPEEGQSKRQPGKPWLENAIAREIRQTLDSPPRFLPKGETQYRHLRPGDIAVLCRSNKDCQDVAEALHQAGLEVAISRSGLLQTAEAKLVLAALKYLLNPYDTLAIAELLVLGEGLPIAEVLDDRLRYLDQRDAGTTRHKWAHDQAMIERIEQLRGKTPDVASTEMLEIVLDQLDLRRIVVSWGQSDQRLDNIDQLRSMARQYEEACTRLHTAASLGGFLLWLNDQERQETDKQGAGERPQAVNVLTYHRSKGLEWPMVICHSLEKTLRADIWGMDLIQRSEALDLNDVLGNRWLRYWVNPYDRQFRKTNLEERLQASDAMQDKIRQARMEDARLLYVGVTRARDFLVFPTSGNPSKWLNRTWNEGDESIPTLDPDSTDTPWYWNEKNIGIETKVVRLGRDFSSHSVTPGTIRYLEPPAGQTAKPLLPFYIDERQYQEEALNQQFVLKTVAITKYGLPLSWEDEADAQALGQVVKNLLTAWHGGYSDHAFLQLTGTMLDRFELPPSITAEDILRQVKGWYQYQKSQFQPKASSRKFALHLPVKDRHFRTVLDGLLETSGGLVLIQHSGFSGPEKKWKNHVASLGVFFYLSNQALGQLFPDQAIRMYLHLPLSGALMEVSV